MQFKYRIGMRAIALAFAIGAATAGAQSALEIRQDRLQLQSDRAALQRQIARLAADEARLKADTASGKMSAQSKDAYAVYQAELAAKGAMDNVNAYTTASPQIRADKAALQRQMRLLEIAEAKLKSAKASGLASAESKGSTEIARSQLDVKGAQKAVASASPGSLQMKSDMASLQRALARLESAEAQYKADKAAGKMSVESKDSVAVYRAARAVKGAKEDVAEGEAATLQMAADKVTLQRQLKRLELAEARLASSTKSGKSSAQSTASTDVARSRQAVNAQAKQVEADKVELKSDLKK